MRESTRAITSCKTGAKRWEKSKYLFFFPFSRERRYDLLNSLFMRDGSENISSRDAKLYLAVIDL